MDKFKFYICAWVLGTNIHVLVVGSLSFVMTKHLTRSTQGRKGLYVLRCESTVHTAGRRGVRLLVTLTSQEPQGAELSSSALCLDFTLH